MPAGAVYVGRPTKWGNPFSLGSPSGLKRVPAVHYPDKPWEYEGRISGDGTYHPYVHADGSYVPCYVHAMTPAESVECYRAYALGGGWPIDWTPRRPFLATDVQTLRGKDLCCWCPLDAACHADVLLALANSTVRVGL